jgi:hypothetical protein
VFNQSDLKQNEFSKRCGRKQQNITAYLNKSKPLEPKTLNNCLENFYGWPVIAHRELAPFNGDFSDFPEVPGIYIFYNSEGNVVYFGKATNLRTRAKSSYNSKSPFSIRLGPNLNCKQKCKKGDFVKFVSLYEIKNENIRHNFEAFLLHVFPNQSHNNNSGYFKLSY